MRSILLFLLLVPLAFDVCATQMKPLTIEDLTKRADRIVHGTVVSKKVQRDAAGRIYTTVELKVLEHWRGSGPPQNSFTIVHAGGVLGEEGVVASGQEQFDIGEEVIVFAVLNARGQTITVGMAQGKFTVSKDKGSGRSYASNPFHHGKTGLTVEALKARVKGGAQ